MKNIKRLLCVCLIACICFCAVGCKKNTDNSSSGLSSTVTQTETSSIDSKIESTEEKNSTEESKTNKEDRLGKIKNAIKSGRNLYQYSIPDTIINNIVDFHYGTPEELYFITNNGDLYQLSLDKPFSNETYCKKVDTQIKFKKFLGLTLLDENNNFYNYSFDLENPIDSENWLNKISPNEYNNIFLVHSSPNIFEYLIVKGNNIFSCSTNDLIFTIPDDENIEYVLDNTIKTNKYWYAATPICINKEESKKYADIEKIFKIDFVRLNLDSDIIFYKESKAFKNCYIGFLIINNKEIYWHY